MMEVVFALGIGFILGLPVGFECTINPIGLRLALVGEKTPNTKI